MGFFLDTVLLPFLFGTIGMLLVLLGRKLIDAPPLRRQFDNENEKLVMKMQELVRAQNEVLLLELDVTELVEKATPAERTRWVVRMRELAHALPPMVLAQAHRFGLAEPPPLVGEVGPSHRPVGTEGDGFAQVVEMNGWTGRVGGDG